jgi:hypothetical protein
VIVGIAGYAGAGKDTAAAALTAIGWRQDAFAAPLKAMALDINPWVQIPESAEGADDGLFVTMSALVNSSVWGWDGAKQHEGARRFLQRLGAAVRKHLGEDAWVDALMTRYHDEHDALQLTVPGEYHPAPEVVVSDVRYENEARRILEEGICLLWVSRPGIGPANDHESEDGQVRHLCTHEIANDGTVEELHRKVREAVGV